MGEKFDEVCDRAANQLPQMDSLSPQLNEDISISFMPTDEREAARVVVKVLPNREKLAILAELLEADNHESVDQVIINEVAQAIQPRPEAVEQYEKNVGTHQDQMKNLPA